MFSDLVPGLTRWDEQAWQRIVDEHGPRIWAVTRSHRLNDEDAADVFQTTMLNLAEHLGDLKEPARVAAWIVTTAKNECMRVIRMRRPLPLKWRPESGTDDDIAVPEHTVLADARDRELWTAIRRLPARCQQLLRLFAYLPEYTYAELAGVLDLGMGSVGQAKGRCLRLLRLRLADVR
ncbi:RNA polymerase sigma factor [Actinocrispum wychmicini]|uniref:RNA polymerase sigma factor (Sigma-70 family) n=1 Tax=Actinocrispum wychmicini TaxID=1213861 RepID=A0A4V2S8V1_9PSEU|nr:sigma-70 family RNA polymerase sigma factor [Actinocrispum wychmicini]TCO65170.1 RNA polymerase sigma factor (sigma-70 family) [Actinocrispum wychmicini]